MNPNGRYTIRILAGGYLAYIGFDLVRGVLQEDTQSRLFFLAVGIAFMILGAVIVVTSLRVMKDNGNDQVSDSEEDDEEEIIDDKEE